MKQIKITILFLLIGFAGMAQSKSKLVADETTLTYLKASVKLETSNEVVFGKILAYFKGELKKYTVEFKSDRSGLYKSYTVPFKNEDIAKVETFIKTLK